ncbi:hypothetical protein SAY87_029827 [Trapa incisa]|uniref:MYB transcription factor n=1 Tax=Trapa incisa TaxID=236973 RepID=A0AAN7Q9K2_9MYRT|nr:hypothetical protein SAY87_029827 [Trapa incisa]
MSEASTITTAPDVKCKEGSCKRTGRCACLIGSQKINGLDKDFDCLIPEPLKKNKKNATVARDSVSNGEKRQWKPPRRYIEESSRADSKHRLKQESIVAKHKPHLWREPKKKHTGLLESESEHSSSASESETEVPEKISSKSIDRKKNQRMWTVQEVIKLVDGICQLGVGHWSDIKRLSFASSTYRTPIDLRNKWRNLLRASRAQKLEKGEAEHKEKSAVRPLPRSLLWRVRELEAVHPYPRKTKTRCSFFPKSS